MHLEKKKIERALWFDIVKITFISLNLDDEIIFIPGLVEIANTFSSHFLVTNSEDAQ